MSEVDFGQMRVRGMLDSGLEAIWLQKTGDKLTTRKLRLIAHLDYLLKNGNRIKCKQVNDEEEDIISEWTDNPRYLVEKDGRIYATPEFWDAMQSVLYYSYHMVKP